MSRDYADVQIIEAVLNYPVFSRGQPLGFLRVPVVVLQALDIVFFQVAPGLDLDELDGLHRGVFQAVRGLLGDVDALVAPDQHDLLADGDPGGARDHHPVFRRGLSGCQGIFLAADFRGLPAATQSHPQCGQLRSANLRPHGSAVRFSSTLKAVGVNLFRDASVRRARSRATATPPGDPLSLWRIFELFKGQWTNLRGRL